MVLSAVRWRTGWAIQKEMTSLGVQAMEAYGTYKQREAETAARERLSREGVPAGEMEGRIKNSEEVRKAEESYGPGSAYRQAGRHRADGGVNPEAFEQALS